MAGKERRGRALAEEESSTLSWGMWHGVGADRGASHVGAAAVVRGRGTLVRAG